MSEIVFARDGQALTTSAIIAEGVNVQHKNILAILRNYRSDFEEFGIFAFETRKIQTNGGSQNSLVALLNQQQATLLVTYCKNTEVVRKFKVALVKAFFDLNEQLHPTNTSVTTLTPSEQHAVQRAVASRAQKTASNYQTIYRAIKARYQIARYDQLPRTQLADCLDFIKEVELAVPEVPHTTHTHNHEGRCPCCGLRPLPEGSLVLPSRDAEAIMNFVYMWRYLFRAEIELFYQMLRSVQSPHAARFFETFNDLNLPALEETLKRYGYDLTKLPCYLALNASK